MAAGSQEGNAFRPVTVNGDKAINVLVVTEEGFNSPQVSQPLFADIPAEDDIAHGFNAGFI
jgi:hypothetical protein